MGAFRRRILITPSPGSVTAELEDDWHRMRVTLAHDGTTITAVDSAMPRRPWTTCPGAIDRLAATFVGTDLADASRRGEKTANCTHLYDLALFAAAHAGEAEAVAYDVTVADPVAGRRSATIACDDIVVLGWTLAGDTLLDPPALAGQSFAALGSWIAAQDPALREAARILRWATMMAHGRRMTIPADSPALPFASRACFTFQPDRAAVASRNPDADRDFADDTPLADRAAYFAR